MILLQGLHFMIRQDKQKGPRHLHREGTGSFFNVFYSSAPS